MSIAMTPPRKIMSAFRALSSRGKAEVLTILIKDRAVREDLLDLAVAESRRHEPARPLRKMFAEVDAATKRR